MWPLHARRMPWCLTALICCLPLTAFAKEPTASEGIDFNRDIRPIFTSHCTSCHGGVKQAGGLSFIHADGVMDYVDSDSPEDSYLMERINEDDSSRMPPADHGRRLNAKEISLLERWMEQGAQWGKHWAYSLPKRHPSPKVSDQAWCQQPIDAFVLKELDDHQIQPSPVEKPSRWLRRVSLDLIGLPPTLEERSEFLADLANGESAYERAVDRLLQSPQFGERWASVWFDQVRYADSRGYGEDSPREIWKYRDWVIDAFNQDMPYDQFTIKQIAGDLLPGRTIGDRIATAVHRLTHTNEEGGTDDEEFRVIAIMDRISTTWQTWQGTTFGCVQCHHHPYDPFDHDEYYKFAAYFNNTVDCDLSDDWPLLDVPVDSNQYEKASQLDQQIDSLKTKLWKDQWKAVSTEDLWQPLKIDQASTSNRTKLVVEPGEAHDEYRTVGTVASGPTMKFTMPLPDSCDQLTGLRLTALPMDLEKALADAEVGFVMTKVEADVIPPPGRSGKKKGKNSNSLKVKFSKAIGDEPFPRYNPSDSLKEGKTGFGAYTRIHHPRSLVLTLEQPMTIEPGSKLSLRVQYRVFDLAAFILAARRGHFAVSSDPSLISMQNAPSRIKAEKQLASLEKRRKEIKSVTLPILAERPDHLKRPTRVFVRGNFLTKDKEVFPDVPHSLHDAEAPVGDRLQLARWMVSEGNPLTARVAVNRFWARMFGVGLVQTEEDFGSTGDPPSHPELLDDLAVRFREDMGWSLKSLLREIALSSTYRQSSKVRPELKDSDSSNRLLARGPRHTLPAETVRDEMLAISGLLSHKMHGPGVFPPLPSGVWTARRGSWVTPKPGNEDRYRRSVYTTVKRSIPFPMLASFDAPSRDFCSPKRLRSNTPLQPLMLLNDRGFVECCEAFAQRMLKHSDKLADQIGYGFLLATCREIHSDEMERLTRLYEEVKSESNRTIAMQAVSGVLMNMDEVVTK